MKKISAASYYTLKKFRLHSPKKTNSLFELIQKLFFISVILIENKNNLSHQLGRLCLFIGGFVDLKISLKGFLKKFCLESYFFFSQIQLSIFN